MCVASKRNLKLNEGKQRKRKNRKFCNTHDETDVAGVEYIDRQMFLHISRNDFVVVRHEKSISSRDSVKSFL